MYITVRYFTRSLSSVTMQIRFGHIIDHKNVYLAFFITIDKRPFIVDIIDFIQYEILLNLNFFFVNLKLDIHVFKELFFLRAAII